MEKTSPREALLKHGKWITAKDFAKLVAEKRNVSERQAKTLISKAYRNKEIKKNVFPDRTVIYGLTEFGPPVFTADVLKQVNVQLWRWKEEQRRKEDSYRTGVIP